MPVSRLPSLRRNTVAASIAIAALLSFGALFSPPDAALGFQLFLFAQPFWAIGLVGLGHLTSRRSPVLGTMGAALAALGCFGHLVYGGVRMLLSLLPPGAVDSASDAALSPAFVPFLALGLFGTVLGYVLLAIAIIRARIAPLWVPILLLVWVLAEFALSNLTPWSTYASITLGVVVFITLSVCAWRSPLAHWRTEREAHDVRPAVNGEQSAPASLARETQ